MKKFLLPLLISSLLFVLASCGKDDNGGGTGGAGGGNLSTEEILKLPYSKLTASEQKVKLENEGNALIDMMKDMKTSPSIGAFHNLENLLSSAPIELEPSKAKASTIKEVLQISNVYGIYTWNPTEKDWDKTASTSELKILFPSKSTATSNDATCIVTSTNSGKKYTYTETRWKEVMVGNNVDWVEEKVEVTVELPSAATATIKIGDTDQVKVNFTAQYGTNEIPVKSNFTIELAEGYKLTSEANKAANSKITAKMTYKDTVMFDAEASTETKFDDIWSNSLADKAFDNNLLRDATARIDILTNLAIILSLETKNYAVEQDGIDAKYDTLYNALYHSDNWNKDKDRYTKLNKYRKERAEERANANNQYLKAILASRTDSVKIASVEYKAVEAYSWNDDVYWDNAEKVWKYDSENKFPDIAVKNYSEKMFFRFGDNTLVDADAYFSEGFSTFTSKWEDFIEALGKK